MALEERTVFASTILVEKEPHDVSNIYLSRLLESKGLNNQIGSFLFDYMTINRHYTSKLKKVLDTKGKSLNESIEQYIKKESQHDLKYKDATYLSQSDHLGEFAPLWEGLLQDIREEIVISETFCSNMEKQLISPLKKCFDLNKNKKYNNMLESIGDLSLTASSVHMDNSENPEEASHPHHRFSFGKHNNEHKKSTNSEWLTKSSAITDTFENFEYNRLLFLKDVLISFQNNLNFRFNENLKHNENLFSLLVDFNPDEEINRFAKFVTSSDKSAASTTTSEKPGISMISTAKPVSNNVSADGMDEINSPPIINESKHSALNNRSAEPQEQEPRLVRQDSAPSTVASEEVASHKKKHTSGLRSKVGTLFGRNKKKDNAKNKRRSNSIDEIDTAVEQSHNVVHESPVTSPIQEAEEPEIVPASKPQDQAKDFSINQTPLVPTMRNTASISSVPTMDKPLPTNPPGYKDATYTNGSSSNAAGTNAPPPPAARKSVEPIAAGIPVQQQPETAKKNRKDIQSKLFTNLTAADIMEQGNLANINNRMSFIGEESPHNNNNSFPPLPRNATDYVANAANSSAGSVSRNSTFFGGFSDPSSINPGFMHQRNNSNTSLQHSQVTTTNKSTLANKFVHPELVKTGLNASISELIKVDLIDGVTNTIQVIGEVAFTYIKPQSTETPNIGYIKLLDNYGILQKLTPNNGFLEPLDSSGSNNETAYLINLSQISSKMLGGLKYMTTKTELPVIILPIWRFEQHQASCMITIKLSDRALSLLHRANPSAFVELENFLLSIGLDDTPGLIVNSAMSRPAGVFNKERKRITWKITGDQQPIRLSLEHPEQKIVARFMISNNGTGLVKECKKGAQAKFSIKFNKGGEFAVSDIGLKFSSVESNNNQQVLGNGMNWEDFNIAKTFSTSVFNAHSI